jgi:hypothetical protein
VGSSAIKRSGSHKHRHGDHDALAHAARQLVRELLQAAAGLRDAHSLQPVHAALLGCIALQLHVNVENFLELVAHLHMRRQRGERILEDHRHRLAAHRVELFRRQVQDFLAGVLDRSFRFAVGGQKPHSRQESLALAGPGFADHGEAFARFDLQIDAAHGMDFAIGRVEADIEIFNLEDGRSGIGQGGLPL